MEYLFPRPSELLLAFKKCRLRQAIFWAFNDLFAPPKTKGISFHCSESLRWCFAKESSCFPAQFNPNSAWGLKRPFRTEYSTATDRCPRIAQLDHFSHNVFLYTWSWLQFCVNTLKFAVFQVKTAQIFNKKKLVCNMKLLLQQREENIKVFPQGRTN